MQDRKEETPSRAARYEQIARDAVDSVASIKVDTRLLRRYGHAGDPLKWAVGKLGFFVGKSVDALEFVGNSVKEECCKSRPKQS